MKMLFSKKKLDPESFSDANSWEHSKYILIHCMYVVAVLYCHVT